jgi:hypothetical protein
MEETALQTELIFKILEAGKKGHANSRQAQLILLPITIHKDKKSEQAKKLLIDKRVNEIIMWKDCVPGARRAGLGTVPAPEGMSTWDKFLKILAEIFRKYSYKLIFLVFLPATPSPRTDFTLYIPI